MVLAFVIGSTAVVNAQSDAAASFAPLGPFVFLAEDSLKPDRSYLFQHTDGDLVFEAQIAPDIMIVDHSSG